MAGARQAPHILALAKRGAAVRFHELVSELDMLFSAFPDLHDAFDPEDLPVWFILKRDAPRNAGRVIRRRKPMSAAGKRAVSRRMKKYWAERRASTPK